MICLGISTEVALSRYSLKKWAIAWFTQTTEMQAQMQMQTKTKFTRPMETQGK